MLDKFNEFLAVPDNTLLFLMSELFCIIFDLSMLAALGKAIDFDKSLFPSSKDFFRVLLVIKRLSSFRSNGSVGFFGGEYQSMTLFSYGFLANR